MNSLSVFFRMSGALDGGSSSESWVKEYTRADWKSFSQFVDGELSSLVMVLSSATDIDSAVRLFESAVHDFQSGKADPNHTGSDS